MLKAIVNYSKKVPAETEYSSQGYSLSIRAAHDHPLPRRFFSSRLTRMTGGIHDRGGALRPQRAGVLLRRVPVPDRLPRLAP